MATGKCDTLEDLGSFRKCFKNFGEKSLDDSDPKISTRGAIQIIHLSEPIQSIDDFASKHDS